MTSAAKQRSRDEEEGAERPPLSRILVVDVGGSYVKLLATGQEAPRKFASGLGLTADDMVSGVLKTAGDWEFDAVSIGYPGVVRAGRPVKEPFNLGKGWVGFDFDAAFGRPVRILNDAAMQALGGYQGGRMLFIGLGTGMGSAMIDEHFVVALELGHLPHPRGRTYEDHLGARALRKRGVKRWQRAVRNAVEDFRLAFFPDYVVIGGGNADQLNRLPSHTLRGDNFDAFLGGFHLWEGVRRQRPPEKPKAEVVAVR